jgi:hypothetical protein
MASNEVQMNSTQATSSKPDKLVLTKAEILAALKPIQTIAARIAEYEAMRVAYNEALPDDYPEDDFAEYEIEVEDADLELYDAIDGIRDRDDLYELRSLVSDFVSADIVAREEAEQAAKKARRKAARETKNVADRAKADPAFKKRLLEELAD